MRTYDGKALSNGKVRVSIWHESGYDKEAKKYLNSTIFDVHDLEGDCGCGFLVLDRPEDVLLLREALERYVRKHIFRPSKFRRP